MVNIMKTTIIVLFILLTACSTLKKRDAITVLSVDSSGTDGRGGAFCSDFALNKYQAQSFFERADIITIKQLHDNYLYLPCFVRGKAELEKMVCDWEIRAGGTGELNCGEEVQLYGCTSCDDILR
jgi:hypothetical protein